MIPFVDTVRKLIEKINIKGKLRTDEPMAFHTTFRTGGPADVFAVPEDEEDVRKLFAVIQGEGIPLFILGGGANILVSDRGIRGIVIDMCRFSSLVIRENSLIAQAGVSISSVAESAQEAGFSGPDTFYAMPGSVGGSIWMNARCYGRSISDILEWAEFMDFEGRTLRLSGEEGGFDYKLSPFQTKDAVIVQASFRLIEENRDTVRKRMEGYKRDREGKGHFLAPSAGSVFKNNRDFGNPTGKIIDSLGLRGYTIGGARISPVHGNIIINTGGARASDIRDLIEFTEKKVFEAYGYKLEREIRLIGDWDSV
ncbi:MAG TPA: UDP-N-acetylmuramate dehydrogenase [Spirochaetia bacterium]|nr:UDP-N-acetylmuramate dehydrogenase [Spirochaetia bacterium]